MSILLNDGNGTFAPKIDYETDPYPVLISAADVTGDGYLDLVVPANGEKLNVFVNDGNGTFASKVDYVTGRQPSSIAIADLSGDCRQDIAVAHVYSNWVAMMAQDGAGNLVHAADHILPYWGTTGVIDNPIMVVPGDFDGDGKSDLVVLSFAKDSHESYMMSLLHNRVQNASYP